MAINIFGIFIEYLGGISPRKLGSNLFFYKVKIMVENMVVLVSQKTEICFHDWLYSSSQIMSI